MGRSEAYIRDLDQRTVNGWPEVTVDRCPICGEPCHATEGDDMGRHPECQGEIVVARAPLERALFGAQPKPYAERKAKPPSAERQGLLIDVNPRDVRGQASLTDPQWQGEAPPG